MKFVSRGSTCIETSDQVAAELLHVCEVSADAGVTVRVHVPTADEYGQATTAALTVGANHAISVSDAPADDGEDSFHLDDLRIGAPRPWGATQFPNTEQ